MNVAALLSFVAMKNTKQIHLYQNSFNSHDLQRMQTMIKKNQQKFKIKEERKQRQYEQ